MLDYNKDPDETETETGTETGTETETEAPAPEPDKTPAPEPDKAPEKEDPKPEDPAPTDKSADEAPQLEIKVPDGAQIDPEAVAAFKEFAVANKFSQESADATLQFMLQQVAKQQEVQDAALSQMKKEWQDEVKKDPEFGGKKYEASIRHVYAAIQRFGGDPVDTERNALQQELGRLNIESNPEIFRMLARVGRALAEDTPGGKPVAGSRTLTRDERLSGVLYHNSN